MTKRNSFQVCPLSDLVTTLGSMTLASTIKAYRPVFSQRFLPKELKGTEFGKRLVDDSIVAYIHAIQEGVGESEAFSLAHSVFGALLEHEDSSRVDLDKLYSLGCGQGGTYAHLRGEGIGHYDSLDSVRRVFA